MSIVVLEDGQAGTLVCNAPTELREALPMELGGEEQAPAVPLFPGQLRVEVDD
jgi:hypothetical protein